MTGTITPVRAGCPKRMTFGPCGGVRADGGYELGDRACTFLARTCPCYTRSRGRHAHGGRGEAEELLVPEALATAARALGGGMPVR